MRLWFGKVGLGPNILGPLRYLLPYNDLFHIASRYHDIGYGTPGTAEKREKIDNLFLRLMLARCKNDCQKWFANKYFSLVRKFGFLFYKYERKYTIYSLIILKLWHKEQV